MQGSTSRDLERHNPPIYFRDPAWNAGTSLVSYRIKGAPQFFGRQLRCNVVLSLRKKDGKTQEIDAPYMIDTCNVISIVRDF
jgi:hypothetical protein